MKRIKSVASSVIIASVVGAAASVAAQPAPSPMQGQQEVPAAKGEVPDMQGMQGMMGMMNMMGQMDPAQMKQMMENCNKMMEGSMSPSQPPGAEPKKG